MKVYLLPLGDGRQVFYSEGRDALAPNGGGPSRGGLRGWFSRTFGRGGQARVGEDGGSDRRPEEAAPVEPGPVGSQGVAGRLRMAWHWLQRRLAPDEAMLRRLNRAVRIHLYHPATIDSEAVLRRWRDYLGRRYRRHWFWLVVTLLVAPLTIVLTIVPGPNVIGYWFAYRAICHLRVVLGTRRALGCRVETSLHPTPALEPGPGLAEEEWIARISRRYRLRQLGTFLERVAEETEAELAVVCDEADPGARATPAPAAPAVTAHHDG